MKACIADALREQLRELNRDLERLENQLDSPLKSTLLGKARMKLSVAELKLKQLDEDLTASKENLKDQDSGRMECGVAYAGTEINFGDEFLRLRRPQSLPQLLVPGVFISPKQIIPDGSLKKHRFLHYNADFIPKL